MSIEDATVLVRFQTCDFDFDMGRDISPSFNEYLKLARVSIRIVNKSKRQVSQFSHL